MATDNPMGLAGGIPPSQVPSQLGPYRVMSLLGKGGMGVVLKAWDEKLERPVALKVIAKEYADSHNSLVRLQTEAQAAAQLIHQNIVSVYAFDEINGFPFIAMEFVEGKDLSEAVRQSGPMVPGLAISYIRQAAEALAYAATRNIVHRDIKPSNLIITKTGQLKVMDFGVAKRLDVDLGLTSEGSIIGTPHYMSPEQALGRRVTFQADMYSLGMTLYTLLTGRRPFDATTPFEVMTKHVNEPLAIPREWGQIAGGQLVAVLVRMTAKNPEDRYMHWEELVEELRSVERALRDIRTPIPYSMGTASAGMPIPPAHAGILTNPRPLAPKRKKSNKVLIAAAILLLLLFLGAGALAGLAMLGNRNSRQTPTPVTMSEPPAPANPEAVSGGISIQLPGTVSQDFALDMPNRHSEFESDSKSATGDFNVVTRSPSEGPRFLERLPLFQESYYRITSTAEQADFATAVQILENRVPIDPDSGGPMMRPGLIELDVMLENVEAAYRRARDFDAWLVSENGTPGMGANERARLTLDLINKRAEDPTRQDLMAPVVYLHALRSPEGPAAMASLIQRFPNLQISPEDQAMLNALRMFNGQPPLRPPGAPPPRRMGAARQ